MLVSLLDVIIKLRNLVSNASMGTTIQIAIKIGKTAQKVSDREMKH